MKDPIDADPPEEGSLGALFDRTAQAPSEMTTARLSATAKTIAESGARQRRLVSRGVWPLAALAAAAATYIAFAPPPPAPTEVLPEASKATPPVAEPSLAAPVREPVAPAAGETEPDDVVAVVLGDEADFDPFDLGPLMDDEEGR